MRPRLTSALLALAILAPAAQSALQAPVAQANTSHAGWPAITGMLLMNKQDQSRPLDGRVGHDPFDGADPTYSCDGLHRSGHCDRGHPAFSFLSGGLVPPDIGHNYLLGGHGNNTLYAGPSGDVLWGDYKPSGDPATQVNYIHGGPGRDIIYAAHGTNFIWTGGGPDIVHVHFGHGEVHCDSPEANIFMSRQSSKRYKLFGCKNVSM